MFSSVVSIALWFLQNVLFGSSPSSAFDGSGLCRCCRIRPVRLATTTTPAKGERMGALIGFMASLREIPGPGILSSYASSEQGR